MPFVVGFIAEHWAMLLGGSTALLSAGSLAALLVREPAYRQRIGELTVGAVLVWLVLACVPMRRMNAATAPAERASAARIVLPEPVPGDPAQAAVIPLAEIPPELIAEAAHSDAVAPASIVSGPAHPEKRAVHLRLIAAWAWATGVGAALLWLVLGRFGLMRIIRRSEPAPAWVNRLLSEMPEAGELNARIRVSRSVGRPVSFGVWRAWILLPAAVVDAERPQRLRQVLLHELAHVRRRDAWGNLVLNAGMAVLYAHPLYWWLRDRVILAREMLADEWAAGRSDRQAYAEELVGLARMEAGAGRRPVATIGLMGSSSHFYRRMHMLLSRNRDLRMGCSRGGRMVMAAVWCTGVAGAAALMGVSPAPTPEQPAADVAPTPSGVAAGGVPVLSELPVVGRLFANGESGLTPQPTATLQVGEAVNAPAADAAPAGPPPLAGSNAVSEASQQRRIALLQAKLAETQAQLAALQRELAMRPDPATIAGNMAVRRMPPKAVVGNESGYGMMGSASTSLRPPTAATAPQSAMAGMGGFGSSGAIPAAGMAGGMSAPSPAMPVATSERRAVSGVQLDLVNLANSAVDAAGNLQIAEAQLSQVEKMAQQAAASQIDLLKARTSVQTARRKVELFRGLVKVSLESAEKELATAEMLFANARAPQSQREQAQAKVEMLKLILKSME